MSFLNKAQIIGNVGQTPESKTFPSGQTVCNFSVATTKKWKDQSGQPQEKTTWHNVTAWAALAEVCLKYITKGSKVYIEGELETDCYEKDGVKQYRTKIVVKQLILLTPKQQTQVAQSSGIPDFDAPPPVAASVVAPTPVIAPTAIQQPSFEEVKVDGLPF